MAARADALCFPEAPLRVLCLPSLRLGRHVVSHRGTASEFGQPHVGGDQLMLPVELKRRIGGLQPKRLVDQSERHLIQTVRVLHVGVAMHLHLGPYSQHRRHVWQLVQQCLLHVSEACSRVVP